MAAAGAVAGEDGGDASFTRSADETKLKTMRGRSGSGSNERSINRCTECSDGSRDHFPYRLR